MPGWHKATAKEQQAGAVRVVGIIQEQHPDRCRLFMQWKSMDWPVMVDSLNELELTGVPITLFIDEKGIIQGTRVQPQDLQQFLTTEGPEQGELTRFAPTKDYEEALRGYADSLFKWGGTEKLDETIRIYTTLTAQQPDDGRNWFRLGVSYRARFDRGKGAVSDFSAAIESWRRALELDPNQYIWRRRIQQYGPRLDKPYPFYDWVTQARSELMVAGQQPLSLLVEPGGAEIAHPLGQSTLQQRSKDSEEPDPRGRVYRDEEGYIQIESVVAPDTSEKQAAFRVHLIFGQIIAKAHGITKRSLMVWLRVTSCRSGIDCYPLEILAPRHRASN